MKRLLVILGIALAAGLLPARALADDGGSRDGLVVRIKGDVVVAAGETVGSVVVINGDAVIEGRVRHLVLVIRGDARVTGTVEDNVTVVDGDLTLGRTARVKDVSLVRGDLTREAGSTVTGDVNRRAGIAFRGAAALFSIFLWAGMTVAVLAAGLVFAGVGGRQLAGASRLMTAEIGYSLLSTLVLWVGMPILAVLLILTVIGIPLGLGLLVFLLPTLWFLGYLVGGTRLGGALVGLAGRESGEHPYPGGGAWAAGAPDRRPGPGARRARPRPVRGLGRWRASAHGLPRGEERGPGTRCGGAAGRRITYLGGR